jgi:hypothetical protein
MVDPDALEQKTISKKDLPEKKIERTILPLSPDDYQRFEHLLFNLSANFINLPEEDIDKEIEVSLKQVKELKEQIEAECSYLREELKLEAKGSSFKHSSSS